MYDFEDLDDDSLAEIKQLYAVEAQEHVSNITSRLFELEKDTGGLKDALADIYRGAHSIKGDSNALGIIDIGHIAHEMESFLSDLQKNPEKFDSGALDELFRYVDILREKLANLSQPEQESNGEVDLFNDVSPKKKDKPEPENDVSPEKALPAFQFEDPARINVDKKNGIKTGDDKIRIPISKIDKLVNLSGELLISRLSYEQRLTDLKNILNQVQKCHRGYKSRERVPDSGYGIKSPLPRPLSERGGNSFRSPVTRHPSLKGGPDSEYRIDSQRGPDSEYRINKMNLNSKVLNQSELEIFKNTLGGFEEELAALFKDFRKDNQRFSFLIDELQYDAINTRMLQAEVLVEPLKISVRNTSKKLNKLVQFSIIGEEIEIDRMLIEKMKDPISHLVRNAIDHGIETPDERRKAGKPEMASLLVNISLSGNNVIFEVKDDGQGLNYEKIRGNAVKLGISSVEEETSLSEDELNQIIFVPGFSTADTINDISGRGVGLDVVKAMIEELNGHIRISSQFNQGTCFTMTLPLTLSTFNGFLVCSSGQTFAIPKASVANTLNIRSQDIVFRNNSSSININGKPVKLVDLSEVLELRPQSSAVPDEITALIIESGAYKAAFAVDEIIGSRELVMKGLGSQLQRVRNVAGATLLGTGEPVIILNVADMIGSIYHGSFVSRSNNTSVEVSSVKNGKHRVLVVDDSVTTRTLEKNILEFAGFEVVLAKDGLEGKAGVEKYRPDLVITDVEMPKMNGYEFSYWLKKESVYSNTPVIMITSLASEEFKRKGLDCGVDSFIVKGQFDQKKLLDTIAELV